MNEKELENNTLEGCVLVLFSAIFLSNPPYAGDLQKVQSWRLNSAGITPSRLPHSTSALTKRYYRLHLAANKRSEAAESKLLSAQKELQELKLPQQKENEDMHNFVDAARYAYSLPSRL